MEFFIFVGFVLWLWEHRRISRTHGAVIAFGEDRTGLRREIDELKRTVSEMQHRLSAADREIDIHGEWICDQTDWLDGHEINERGQRVARPRYIAELASTVSDLQDRISVLETGERHSPDIVR